MTGLDACLSMHTALRKVCDSPQTSALYNLIHLLDYPPHFHPWKLYGELVAGYLQRTDPITETFLPGGKTLTLKTAAGQLEGFWLERTKSARAQEPPNVRCALYAMTSLFRLMDDKDWSAIAAYL